jgi:lipase chaperone LimK
MKVSSFSSKRRASARLFRYCAAAIAFAGALLLWRHYEPVDDSSAQEKEAPALTIASETVPIKTVQQHSAQQLGERDSLPPIPPSLQGTDAPKIELDDSGQLVASIALRNLFDYFLAGVDEEPLQTCIDRIRNHLRSNISGAAQAQALAILDQYIGYRNALVDFEKNERPRGKPTATDMRIYANKLRDQRELYFDPEISAAFFNDEDAYTQYALDRFDLQNTAGLSAAEREQKLAYLRSNLPEHMRNIISDSQQPMRVAQQIDQLRANGASAYEIDQARIALVGPDAAERLAALDQTRSDWNARIDQYLDYKRELAIGQGDSNTGKEVALKQWLDDHFSAAEQLRLGAAEQKRAIK